jgi:2-polyprenyl-3-methyl-5-hydroxy-6-metoxy-1,4-benzoquinol methylase
VPILYYQPLSLLSSAAAQGLNSNAGLPENAPTDNEMTLIRRVMRSQVKTCQWFDSHFLPKEYRSDGNRSFRESILPSILRRRPGVTVVDVGSGKSPSIPLEIKHALNLRVIGLDVSESEMRAAPPDSYDRLIVADAQSYRENLEADIAICCALLEHVADTSAVIRTLATLLRRDGMALLFIPCRNALFARLNLLLPQSLKRRLLFHIFPQTRAKQGFPAYYDRCTPRQIVDLLTTDGFAVEEVQMYFYSGYLEFFAPLFMFWRVTQVMHRAIAGNQACEGFTIRARKP